MIADWLVEAYEVSKRRAYRLMQLSWSSYNYQPVKRDERALIMRIRDLAAARVRYGYRRITVLLKREGWSVGKKRFYRLYKAEGLEVRTKKRKKRAAKRRVALPAASAAQERWSMDFMSDRLTNGRPFRILTVGDQYTRACPLLLVDTSIGGRKVAAALMKAAAGIGLPKTITVDNGPEFAGKVLDEWAYGHGIKLDFIRPGRPVENGYIESFNGRLQDELLNPKIFCTLAEVKEQLESWRFDYNIQRPHCSLGYRPSAEYAQSAISKQIKTLATLLDLKLTLVQNKGAGHVTYRKIDKSNLSNKSYEKSRTENVPYSTRQFHFSPFSRRSNGELRRMESTTTTTL